MQILSEVLCLAVVYILTPALIEKSGPYSQDTHASIGFVLSLENKSTGVPKLSYILMVLSFLSCATKQNKEFDWTDIETNISNEKKQARLSQINDKVMKSYDLQARETHDLSIYNLFHFVDITGDNKDDVIFNGYGGASDEYVMIFARLDDHYIKIWHEYGHIDKVGIDSVTYIYLTRSAMVGEDAVDSVVHYKIKGELIQKVYGRSIKK